MDAAARVTSKGQVTIPKAVRDALGIKEGDVVVFRVEGRRAVLARTPDFLDLAGTIAVPAAKRNVAWDEVIRRTRSERAAGRIITMERIEPPARLTPTAHDGLRSPFTQALTSRGRQQLLTLYRDVSPSAQRQPGYNSSAWYVRRTNVGCALCSLANDVLPAMAAAASTVRSGWFWIR
jgi:antitoxin PrlF